VQVSGERARVATHDAALQPYEGAGDERDRDVGVRQGERAVLGQEQRVAQHLRDRIRAEQRPDERSHERQVRDFFVLEPDAARDARPTLPERGNHDVSETVSGWAATRRRKWMPMATASTIHSTMSPAF